MYFIKSEIVLVPQTTSYLIVNVASESSSLVFPSHLSFSHDTVAESMRRNNSSKIFNFTEVRGIIEILKNTQKKNDMNIGWYWYSYCKYY